MKKILFIIFVVLLIAGCATKEKIDLSIKPEKPLNYEARVYTMLVLSPGVVEPWDLPILVPALLGPNETPDEGMERIFDEGLDMYYVYWGVKKFIEETKDNQEFQESYNTNLKPDLDEILPGVEITAEIEEKFLPDYDEAVNRYKKFLLDYERQYEYTRSRSWELHKS